MGSSGTDRLEMDQQGTLQYESPTYLKQTVHLKATICNRIIERKKNQFLKAYQIKAKELHPYDVTSFVPK
jgi:hypothetical protein